MKNVNKVLVILAVLVSANVFAINLRSFHGKNFQPIGSYCGLHLEVSGRSLVVTNIIPPDVPAHTSFCDLESKWRRCGSSIMLECDSTGECVSKDSDQEMNLTLLEDGNIFNRTKSVKVLRTSRSDYEWCD